MIIIVDTNILFSACLTPNGRIFEILFTNSSELISSYYAIAELQQHKQKLIKLSGHTTLDMDVLITTILKQVSFFSEATISHASWIEADRLTTGVDSKDISYVALALQTGGLLWTGDKKLANHLKTIGFNRVVNTAELYQMLNIGL